MERCVRKPRDARARWRHWKLRGKEGFFLRALNFKLLASRSGRQYISVVLGHLLCGTLLPFRENPDSCMGLLTWPLACFDFTSQPSHHGSPLLPQDLCICCSSCLHILPHSWPVWLLHPSVGPAFSDHTTHSRAPQEFLAVSRTP